MDFQIIEVEQGSLAWLALRTKYITASQIPALVGVCPYLSIEDLLEEKLYGTQKDQTGKEEIFQRGHDLENTARNILRDYSFRPSVLVSTLIPTLMASLDGFDQKKNIILEAKYVGRHKLAAIKKGVIPKNHFAQMQAQLMVSRAESCLYWASDGDKIASIMVKPDKDAWLSIEESINWFNSLLEEKKNARAKTANDIFEAL